MQSWHGNASRPRCVSGDVWSDFQYYGPFPRVGRERFIDYVVADPSAETTHLSRGGAGYSRDLDVAFVVASSAIRRSEWHRIKPD
jgi:hypothetical protein